jgi:hypothetical protein
VNSIGHFVHPFLVILIALFVRESAPTREQIEASFAQDSSPQRAEKGSLAAVLLRRPFLLAFQFIHVLLSLVCSQSHFSLPLQLAAVFGEQGPKTYGLLYWREPVAGGGGCCRA